MKGVIYKSTGSWYVIKSEKGDLFNGRMKGKFKIDGITSTNPVAVGDIVEIDESEIEEGLVMITGICDRRNYITRQSPHNKYQHHIIAANIDQSILLATLKAPKTSRGFIDRFLVTAEAYHIPSILVFNKIDIYRKKEQIRLEDFTKDYESIGYKVLHISLLEDKGVEVLINELANKITLIAGHSGVGKSSLLNRLLPGAAIKTQDVSDWSGKGLHTTTFAEMYDLPVGGKVIDTPGLREFALADMKKEELSHYFPEMRKLINQCKFNNCLHLQEPGCAVTAAVNSGEIPVERYTSFLTMMDSVQEKNP
ncbi:ribosome small subunit-dependent GTPase A [soil metagenome]